MSHYWFGPKLSFYPLVYGIWNNLPSFWLCMACPSRWIWRKNTAYIVTYYIFLIEHKKCIMIKPNNLFSFHVKTQYNSFLLEWSPTTQPNWFQSWQLVNISLHQSSPNTLSNIEQEIIKLVLSLDMVQWKTTQDKIVFASFIHVHH